MTASWSAPHTGSTEYKCGSRDCRGQWQAPLGSSRGPTIIRLLAACRRARVRQGQAFGGAEVAPSLTAAARDGDANCGRDERMLAAQVEQKNGMTKDDGNGVMPP